jgi:shikimate kinase
MCTSGPSPDARDALLARVLPLVDPRLSEQVTRDFEEARLEWPRPAVGFRLGVVLAGHRAAGKSRLLPVVADVLARPAVDLDREIERHAGRPVRELFAAAPSDFRRIERERFTELDPGVVVAVGGGFLSLHADLLRDVLTVEVPVTEATYRERLLIDGTRPRLRPELPAEDEVAQVFRERDVAHARVPRWSLAQFLAWAPFPAAEIRT